MGQKRRVLLTGSERAEFEHIYGPLTVDDTDPRFVLVDEETEEKISQLPPGVPARPSQHPRDIAAIRAAELDAWGLAEGEASDVAGGKAASIKAKPLDVEVEASGDREDSEPKSKAKKSK